MTATLDPPSDDLISLSVVSTGTSARVSAVGEIDLVAKRGKLLVFVEVKARARLDDAAEAVTQRQRRRIAAAAEAWLASHPEHANASIRFDALLVIPRRWPRHIPAAFDASP